VLNYNPKLTEIITESKYLEQLGYQIPEIARNLALQEDKFSRYVFHLRRMLDHYHMLLASLDESETLLLEDQLLDLKRSIKPGAKRLNWTALGIQDYINKTKSVYFFEKTFFLNEKIRYLTSIYFRLEHIKARVDRQSDKEKLQGHPGVFDRH
jgi:hypothetical protein